MTYIDNERLFQLSEIIDKIIYEKEEQKSISMCAAMNPKNILYKNQSLFILDLKLESKNHPFHKIL